MLPEISVIVPCYNSADTIIRCCESLIAQTTKVEIIIVNDGSVDNTRFIIEKFIANNNLKNIKLINTENMGVSAARNLGIATSRGKYIGFVDADDYISKDMYSDMVTQIKSDSDIDLVVSDFFYGDSDEKKERLSSPTIITLSREEMTRAIFKKFQYQGFVCNKLYKREIIEKYSIQFNIDMNVMEDLDFNLNYLQYVNNSIFVDNKYYYYCINEEGVMFSGLNDSKIKFIRNYSELLKYNLKDISSLVEVHYTIYLLILLSNYYESEMSDSELEKELIFELKKRKSIFIKHGLDCNKKYVAGYILLLFSNKLFKGLLKLKKSRVKSIEY